MLDVSNDVKAYLDNESNETELSHRWRRRARQTSRTVS